jgi:hypothetical protein
METGGGGCGTEVLRLSLRGSCGGDADGIRVQEDADPGGRGLVAEPRVRLMRDRSAVANNRPLDSRPAGRPWRKTGRRAAGQPELTPSCSSPLHHSFRRRPPVRLRSGSFVSRDLGQELDSECLHREQETYSLILRGNGSLGRSLKFKETKASTRRDDPKEKQREAQDQTQ